MNRNELFKLAVFCIFLGFILEIFMFSRSARACEQETFILDGRVVVCSSCGGVTVCN
jgi:hypothetical protein